MKNQRLERAMTALILFITGTGQVPVGWLFRFLELTRIALFIYGGAVLITPPLLLVAAELAILSSYLRTTCENLAAAAVALLKTALYALALGTLLSVVASVHRTSKKGRS